MKKSLIVVLVLFCMFTCVSISQARGKANIEAISEALTPSGMNVSVAVRTPSKLMSVMLVGDKALSEDLTLRLNSVAGESYDTNIKTISLSSQTNYLWYPDGEIILQKGDTLDITSTYSDTTATVYGVITTEEWK